MTNGTENAGTMSDVERTMAAIEGIVRILGPMTSDERQKVLQGALVVLGETLVERKINSDRTAEDDDRGDDGHVPSRARAWMRQNKLKGDQLTQVFDISGGVATVIASDVSGKNTAEKVIKAYVLAGIGNFLSSGEPTFDDRAARSLCETLGCYDRTNHTKYLKEKGNNFVGDKGGGWKLTAPGLKFAGSVIRELVEIEDAER